jgi:apolipoprotein D and lipocalin family protein
VVKLFLALWAVLLAGCAQAPEGVDPLHGFDSDRYLGTWYEVARLDHRFERGLEDVTAAYESRADGGIDVINRGYDVADGSWREIKGRARFAGPPDVASLEVSFFGPFYGGYNVIDLDPDYQIALVCGPSRDYLWVLARRPDPPRAEIDRVISRAAELGFDTGSLIYVSHGRSQ